MQLASVPESDQESRFERLRRWPLSLTRERRELRRARRLADRELLQSEIAPLRLMWRSAELIEGARRLALAHELRALVEAAQPRHLPNASPLERGAVRVEQESLLALAARLHDLGRPVAPRGILLLERLLVDNDGPLYLHECDQSLDDSLTAVGLALELAV